ncbi:HD domain-containing protein [uncultured Ruminococcus sp.]|uniref:HD domain-containing protein n=1 Tax=uncultured Ruminococcus sp. TaxID=165186 RepID=UPI0025F3A68B|nr:HD domain-containing protein [uncultured Ruminococcus sp.]
MENEIKFVGKILDNVHGFIYYTEAESKIIDTLLFKRLQSIKQLSVADWVFPGSEHTRYIHSLGVMYIADKIAKQLNLSVEDRKIIRLAGLLHDIGHYPLSHVCEFPYKATLESFPDDKFCKSINDKVTERVSSIDDDISDVSDKYMNKSTGFHHEQIGASIVLHNKEIRNIIINECNNNENAPEIIADMIIGNIEHESTNPLFVQILHSELDADGIDYLMRDAMFSGTSFGSFELEQLISCMTSFEYSGKKILCITPKGIAAADQYLINKFFSYSQVVYNKHLSITEWMAEQVVNWMQKNNAYFPQNAKLKEWVEQCETSNKYVDFTDNYFWSSLQNLINNPLFQTEPNFIKIFCEQLLRHNELEYVQNSEVKCVLSDYSVIKNRIQNSKSYKNINEPDKFAILLERNMTKQIKSNEFDKYLNSKSQQENTNINADDKNKDEDYEMSSEDKLSLSIRRFMECVCVCENGELHVLCDDERSLMYTMYHLKLVILRFYKMPNSEKQPNEL